MNETAIRILMILFERGPQRAKKIARDLDLDKSQVNHYLYTVLQQYCNQTDDYEWQLSEDGVTY